MPATVRERSGHRPVRGCLALAVWLALAAMPASLARSTEPAETDIVVKAIPPPLSDEWQAELSSATSSCTGCTGDGSGWGGSRFHADYDNGFAILPNDPEATPFSLRIRNQTMFRYDGFARAERFWTDSAGTQRQTTTSNSFGIPRGRLIFSGDALLPRLSYLLNIDYNSVTNQPIGFRAFWLSYRFRKALELYVGQSKVPGSREWIESAFVSLQSADRTMASTFFRPSLSYRLRGRPDGPIRAHPDRRRPLTRAK